jgi:hypothetical protein
MEKNNNSLDLNVIREWVVENKMCDQELGNKLRGFYWETIEKTGKIQ